MWSVNLRSNTISVLLNTGDGTLGPAVHYDLAGQPVSLALVDVTGDGNLDAVTACFADNTLAVLAGDGAGALGPPTRTPVGLGPSDADLADMNGDGLADVVLGGVGNDRIIGDDDSMARLFKCSSNSFHLFLILD